MQNLEWRTIDMSAWPRGVWDAEPDKKQWTDKATGYPCLIVRNGETLGHLCGYVGVTEGHPAFEKHYDGVDVRCHGGLTYSDFCMKDADEAESICHKVETGDNDRVWWLGFDCAHYQDLSPGMRRYSAQSEDVYRDLAYVEAECAELAAQLKAIAKRGSEDKRCT